MNNQERYWKSVARRNPDASAIRTDVERSYKCLCCYDRGILPTHVVDRYLSHLFEDDGFGVQNLAPYACQNTTCDAGYTEIEIPGKTDNEEGDGEPLRKRVPKFASHGLDQSLNRDLCKWIHDQEFNRLRGLERDAGQRDIAPARVQSVVNNAIATISKPIPKPSRFDNPAPVAVVETVATVVEDLTSVEEVIAHQPMGGFRKGDRVLVSADHLDEYNQKEVKRNNEVPVGEEGIVQSIGLSPVAKELGLTSYVAHLRLIGTGEECDVLTTYLRRAAS